MLFIPRCLSRASCAYKTAEREKEYEQQLVLVTKWCSLSETAREQYCANWDFAGGSATKRRKKVVIKCNEHIAGIKQKWNCQQFMSAIQALDSFVSWLPPSFVQPDISPDVSHVPDEATVDFVTSTLNHNNRLMDFNKGKRCRQNHTNEMHAHGLSISDIPPKKRKICTKIMKTTIKNETESYGNEECTAQTAMKYETNSNETMDVR
eukprot:23161_1